MNFQLQEDSSESYKKDLIKLIDVFDDLFHKLVKRRELNNEDMDNILEKLELTYHATRDTCCHKE